MNRLNWLIFTNFITLLGLPALGFLIGHPVLHALTIAAMIVAFYLIFDRWVLRTTPRIDHIDITLRR